MKRVRSTISALTPVQGAVAMTVIAAILLLAWRNIDYSLLEDLVGYDSGAYWLLAVLLGFIAWGSVAAAIACWLRALRLEPRPRRGNGPSAAPDQGGERANTALEFAKLSSLVAGLLAAVPIALWSYWEIFPRDCGEEACLGSGYLWIFFASIAVMGIVLAVLAWAVYFARGIRPTDRLNGLWLQVVAFDLILLLVGQVAEDREGQLLVIVIALAYLAFAMWRRRASSSPPSNA